MNNTQTPQETWVAVVSRYEDDEKEEQSEFYTVFCNLVRRVVASDYANILFASRFALYVVYLANRRVSKAT